ncbi:MAG: hypothetical protein NZM12_04355, partial [Steroidobacteraceae bacterium]|nr:hypothetical protein [Steroidobacteraceae bacterium]MDW8259849.1 hypothetical protein [Gammaproteobacteria bacterium]
DFDDPLSRPGRGQLPGRLRVLLLATAETPSAQQTAPGDLGYAFYAVRHTELAVGAAAAWLESLGATVLGLGRDEFGEPAIRFAAPDGYQWLALPPR